MIGLRAFTEFTGNFFGGVYMKNFQFHFSLPGLLAFLLVMLPNLFWFAVPAANDVLRADSVTPGLDAAASVCQVLLAAALVALENRTAGPFPRKKALAFSAAAALGGYYLAWGLYYCGSAGGPVILSLALLPCAALLLFALDRKNWFALAFTAVFTGCHLLASVKNFLPGG